MIKIKEYWKNLPKFEKPEDVPKLPVVDEEEWKDFYVPILINAGAIPKNNLIDGKYYIGEHRNCDIARWDAEKNKFIYKRHKFGYVFDDDCNHFEDDDGFALFVPIRLATEEEIKNGV